MLPADSKFRLLFTLPLLRQMRQVPPENWYCVPNCTHYIPNKIHLCLHHQGIMYWITTITSYNFLIRDRAMMSPK
jgi:hypothetical protein